MGRCDTRNGKVTFIHATYLQNFLIKKNVSPLPKFTGTNATVHQLKFHGCLAFARINNRIPDRSEATALRGVFVGLDPVTRSNRIFLPEENRLVSTRDATFDESCRGWPTMQQVQTEESRYTYSALMNLICRLSLKSCHMLMTFPHTIIPQLLLLLLE